MVSVLLPLEPDAAGALLEELELLSFDSDAGGVLDPEAELLDDGLDGVLDPEAELEPDDGLDGVLSEPDAELEPPPDGAVDGEVDPAEDDEDGDLSVLAVLSPPLSQPTNVAPSARETAIAIAESLMCTPPWLGYGIMRASFVPPYFLHL